MSDSESAEKKGITVSNEYVENGTNKLIVKCKFCGSKMLDKKSGKFVKQEVNIFF